MTWGREVARKSKSKSAWKHILYVCVCSRVHRCRNWKGQKPLWGSTCQLSARVMSPIKRLAHHVSFSQSSTNLGDRKPVHPFSFSLARMAHLDQGQIIIQNGLRFFQTRPKIHTFLSLLTDSWHEKRARILPGIVGSQREKMVRTGGTVGIRWQSLGLHSSSTCMHAFCTLYSSALFW